MLAFMLTKLTPALHSSAPHDFLFHQENFINNLQKLIFEVLHLIEECEEESTVRIMVKISIEFSL